MDCVLAPERAPLHMPPFPMHVWPAPPRLVWFLFRVDPVCHPAAFHSRFRLNPRVRARERARCTGIRLEQPKRKKGFFFVLYAASSANRAMAKFGVGMFASRGPLFCWNRFFDCIPPDLAPTQSFGILLDHLWVSVLWSTPLFFV